MNKIYELESCDIKACLEPGLIRVYSDAELWRFLDGKADERFALLVETIKNDYENHFNKSLAISNNSLIVEILVHVYCDYLGLRFNRTVKIKPLNKLVHKLLRRAEVVDCGETAKDSNRWIWDALASFRFLFIKLLPKNLNKRKLKTY
ncbi:hypothetical protein DU508_01085 [Pedobacter chinensis]|uniref:Uncharacterized protein n=1 Tax=Pedobacter chinensis TaxID=2282421 RepID=A0A369Q110_9SPHI|nr:hypothetical protein [Pedobacter chinensis]RDC58621.1 hypothetical protein DU508_01085 [Pedobacter chinensis]